MPQPGCQRLWQLQRRDLASQTAGITISGAGNATVWAKTSLNVTISGTGSVRYYGSPNVSREVSGLGSVTGWERNDQ